MKKKMIVLMILLVLTCVVQPCTAVPRVTATWWTVEDGYRLAFTLTADQYAVPSWAAMEVVGRDLASPEGWAGNSGAGLHYTGWFSYNDDARVQPGQTLQGFAATLPELPAQIEYTVSQVGASEYWGTLVPTPIPEPASFLVLAGGLGTLGRMARRRRRKR